MWESTCSPCCHHLLVSVAWLVLSSENKAFKWFACVGSQQPNFCISLLLSSPTTSLFPALSFPSHHSHQLLSWPLPELPTLWTPFYSWEPNRASELSHLPQTYHQHLQSLSCPSPHTGLGGKGRKLAQLEAEQKSGCYAELGTKGTLRSAPGRRAAQAGLGLNARARSPGRLNREEYRGLEWVDVGTQSGDESHRTTRAQVQSRARSQVKTSHDRRSLRLRWIQGQKLGGSNRARWREAEGIESRTVRCGVWDPKAELKFYPLDNIPIICCMSAYVGSCVCVKPQEVSGSLYSLIWVIVSEMPRTMESTPTPADLSFAYEVMWLTWTQVPVLLVKMRLTYHGAGFDPPTWQCCLVLSSITRA